MTQPTTGTNRAARAYREQAVQAASPEKLVLMLYERTNSELTRAVEVLDTEGATHDKEVGQRLNRALAILGELRTHLDHDAGGEVAENLDGIYEFCQQRIANANGSRESEPLREALAVLRPIEEAWRVVAQV